MNKEIIKNLKKIYKFVEKCSKCKRFYGSDYQNGEKKLCPYCVSKSSPFRVNKEKWEK